MEEDMEDMEEEEEEEDIEEEGIRDIEDMEGRNTHRIIAKRSSFMKWFVSSVSCRRTQHKTHTSRHVQAAHLIRATVLEYSPHLLRGPAGRGGTWQLMDTKSELPSSVSMST